MKIYETLESRRNYDYVNKSNDYQFFQQNRKVLSPYPFFTRLYNANDDFTIIQANIIIQALLNKHAIEDAALNAGKNLKEVVNIAKEGLPSVKQGNSNIYVPLYLQTHNIIYSETPEKLLTFPYSDLVDHIGDSLIDTFEVYNYALYESNFTTLIYLDGDITSRAYLHFDFLTIFIINKQGRLDTKIPLFDKRIKKPVTNHLVDRVMPVVKAYYDGDKKAFVNALHKEKLISKQLYRQFIKGLK